jgi:D-arabinose 1-dehydrogenase-like Zn-dependent alcohol dehydrogenase
MGCLMCRAPTQEAVQGLHGRLLVVGLPAETPHASPFSLITNRRSITGSMIGSMHET